MADAELTSNGWEEIPTDSFIVLANSIAFDVRNSLKIHEDNLGRHLVKLKTKTENIYAIADSRRPMSIPNKKMAQRLRKSIIQIPFTGGRGSISRMLQREIHIQKERSIIAVE